MAGAGRGAAGHRACPGWPCGHALAAYARYRERLRDELGLDPSPRLRRLEQQVLAELEPAVSARPSGNVAPPARTSSFVGREQELALVREALAGGRLVTLVGPGGVGKTRLALQAAAVDGSVWWVDLAPLADPDVIPQAVVDALDLDVQPGSPLLDSLRGWARGAAGLLVLDNCEHLLAAVAGLVQELLGVASALRLLATSRQRLGVDGEQVLVVPPLEVPASGAEDSTAAAVRLFCDRARAADPDFAAGQEVLRRVGDVCRALDGLPLAIELAAARIGTLTIEDLADRLDQRFELLQATPRRRAPPHPPCGYRLVLRPAHAGAAAAAVPAPVGVRRGVRHRHRRGGGGRRGPARRPRRRPGGRAGRPLDAHPPGPHRGGPLPDAGDPPGLRRRPLAGRRV